MAYNRTSVLETAEKWYDLKRKEDENFDPQDAVILALKEMRLEDLSDDEVEGLALELNAIVEKKEREADTEISYPYETLSLSLLTSKNEDVAKCEGLWIPTTEDSASAICNMTEKMLRTEGHNGEAADLFCWENAKEEMENGKTLRSLFLVIRKRTNLRKCPCCGASIPEGTQALSRYDNKTVICSDCGTREAFEDFCGVVGH